MARPEGAMGTERGEIWGEVERAALADDLDKGGGGLHEGEEARKAASCAA